MTPTSGTVWVVGERLSRRQFLATAAAASATAAVPVALEPFLNAARAATPPVAGKGFFLSHAEYETCEALCAQIVPTGSNPVTDPGATEARAVVFIDRFLSAFELPASIADHPAIYLRGRYSGRNAYPDPSKGEPSSRLPGDDFLRGETAHFLSLSPHQTLSWKAQLYGMSAVHEAHVSEKWKKQVGSLIPAPPGLRAQYRDGLAAFDSYSKGLFGVPFAKASGLEQQVMVAVAGNLVLNALPIPLPPPAAPAAAQTLLATMTVHTFQAVYGLPEYSWRNQDNDPSVKRDGGTATWRAIAWDGDTQPLGSSLYDASMHGPGEGPNKGFGDPAVFLPRGGYKEYRPVSTLEPGRAKMTAADLEPLLKLMKRAGKK
jgi:hypothetical protein